MSNAPPPRIPAGSRRFEVTIERPWSMRTARPSLLCRSPTPPTHTKGIISEASRPSASWRVSRRYPARRRGYSSLIAATHLSPLRTVLLDRAGIHRVERLVFLTQTTNAWRAILQLHTRTDVLHELADSLRRVGQSLGIHVWRETIHSIHLESDQSFLFFVEMEAAQIATGHTTSKHTLPVMRDYLVVDTDTIRDVATALSVHSAHKSYVTELCSQQHVLFGHKLQPRIRSIYSIRGKHGEYRENRT